MDAKNSGYPSIRIEGFNCNALDMASSAAAIAGITVLAGIYVSVGALLSLLLAVLYMPSFFREQLLLALHRSSAFQFSHVHLANSLFFISNDVQAFHAAYKKYGAGRFVGLTVGNEVSRLS